MNSLNDQTKELRIPTNFGHLAVKVWNESGTKTPILALHGWMDNAGTWDNLCPLLDKDYPIYALDFAGHGYSSHLPLKLGTYYIDHLVVVDKVIHYFKWKQVILLGHSMGGTVALLYAGTIPHLVEKVVLVDVLRPGVRDAETQPRRTATSLKQLIEIENKFKSEPPRYTYEEIVQKLVLSYKNNLTEAAASTLLIRNSRRHEDGKYSFTHSPLLKVEGTLSITYEQQNAFHSNITCDLLLIKAASSAIYGTRERSIEALNSFKRTSKDFELEVIEGTHHLHLINPIPVAETINRFLSGIPQSDVILLGHSMGGTVALLYAGTIPHLVEKVIAIDVLRSAASEAKSQPSLTATSLKQLIEIEKKIKSEPPRYTYEEMAQKLVLSYKDNLTEEAAKTLLIRNSRRHQDGKYSFTHSPLLKINGTLSVTYEQQNAFYSNVTCDLLLIKAASSAIYGTRERSIEALNSFKRTSKNFEFEVIEGTHHLHMINPIPVAETINRFLSGIPQSEMSQENGIDFIRSKL